MNPLNRILSALADRARPDQDATDRAAGLVVEYRRDGTRVVHHPHLPAIAAAHRARVLASPDAIDRALITGDVRALAAREAAYRTAYASTAPDPPAMVPTG